MNPIAPITDKIRQASAFFLNALPNVSTLLALVKEMTFNQLLAFDPETLAYPNMNAIINIFKFVINFYE
jgi:hypothetical protein